ncbi:MAG TPA: molybdopterin-dependent oxidoreductase, partial [Ferruginibacter sp.]|nr:molybdopterin-dependent oxidoreductase [Ferruginibacter sp.]
AGAIPHRQAGAVVLNHPGLNAYAMLQKPRDAYILLNAEPADFANAHLAQESFKQAKCVIALSMYRDPLLETYADVILPVAPFTETSGTFVNAAGLWQSFTGVATGYANSRPAWKVLRVLANFLQINGFDYESSEAVKHEVKALVDKMPALTPAAFQPNKTAQKTHLSRIGETPVYAIDSITRHSKPLQDVQTIMEGDVAAVRMHTETAKKLHIQDGDIVNVKQAHASAKLLAKLDDRIARDAAWIASGIPETSGLGDLFGDVEIEKG